MKRGIALTVLVMASILGSSNAEVLINGDLEADGFSSANQLPNNHVTTVSNWLGNTRISTTSDGNTIPEAPNADVTFTVSLNACEIYWRAAADGNALTVSLGDAASGTAFVTNCSNA